MSLIWQAISREYKHVPNVAGAMPVASAWARNCVEWLKSNDVLVRFKVLCVLRLLIPRLSDIELSDVLIYSLIRPTILTILTTLTTLTYYTYCTY